MHKILTAAVLGSLLVSFGPVAKAAQPQPLPSHRAGEVLFKMKPGAELSADFIARHGISEARDLDRSGAKKIYKGKVSRNVAETVRSLANDPAVLYAEPNYLLSVAVVPNDPAFPSLWGMNNIGQSGGTPDADIDAPEAWDSATSSALTVGVIDTGIDYTHEDLAANIWTNPGEIAGNGLDDDLNGYVDDVRGWDFANDDNDPMDDHGHGTHVAGTLGAVGDNGIGVAGVLWTVKMAPLKFIASDGNGYTADAVEALLYANRMGFRITNNSWGGAAYSQALYDAIRAADLNGNLFVAAAGNTTTNTDVSPHYPSSYDLENIIAVANTNRNDVLAPLSNYGASSVDLAAPGEAIYSTVPRNGCLLCDPSGYKTLNGTSMAAPHVSGYLARQWTIDMGLGHLALRARLLASTDTIPALAGKVATGGRLNLVNAPNTIPPATITDLSATPLDPQSVYLRWTAVGADDMTGNATAYDVRYSTSPVTNENFSSATAATGEPAPSAPGTEQIFVLGGLSDGETYYFALKTRDAYGNWSGLSNVATAMTPVMRVIYLNDMESGANGWASTGLWHLETNRSASPVTSWAYNTGSPNYTYNTGSRNSGNLTSPTIDLAGTVRPELNFRYYYQTEGGTSFDTRRVSILRNGAVVESVQLSGEAQQQWLSGVLDLTAYIGQTIQVRFAFDTVDQTYNTYEGWYVDDVAVKDWDDNLPPPPGQPVANAGPDLSAYLDQYVTLDGSGSTDDQGIVAYHWDFGDGTYANVAVASHRFSTLGNHVATLTVTDGSGLTSSDTATVTMQPDVVDITSAVYYRKQKLLRVTATSSRAPIAALSIDNIGTMAYDSAAGVYRRDTLVTSAPASVTVRSNMGGVDTSGVSKVNTSASASAR